SEVVAAGPAATTLAGVRQQPGEVEIALVVGALGEQGLPTNQGEAETNSLISAGEDHVARVLEGVVVVLQGYVRVISEIGIVVERYVRQPAAGVVDAVRDVHGRSPEGGIHIDARV